MNKRLISITLILVTLLWSFAPHVGASSSRLLRNGSRGDDVKTLQKTLNEKGFNCGKVDGIFGRLTDSAVRSFQRHHKLVVDGIVGKNTRAKLYGGEATPPSKGNGGGQTKTPITSTLRRGSRGSQVTTLQKRLNELGDRKSVV